jgi:hypothetical protein
MTPYTHLLIAGARRPVAIAGIFMLGLALVAHVLQLLTLGPWSMFVHPWAAWPHDFHLWLLESAALVIGVALLVMDLSRVRIHGLWHAATPLQQWASLAAMLAVCQLLLLLGFWWTKDHDVAELGGLRAAFWLGGEWRLPVLFSVAQLWLASWLAWQCARQDRRSVWRVGALLCAAMGLDELISIHESVGVHVDALGLIQTDASKTYAILGQRFYIWQVVLMPVVLGAGLSLLAAFARATGPATTGGLVLGSLVFLTGALGFESVQAGLSASNPQWWATGAGQLNLLLEEGLEMLGVGVVTLVFAWHHFHGAHARHARCPDAQTTADQAAAGTGLASVTTTPSAN